MVSTVGMHYDNTWNSAVANECSKVTKNLEVDLVTHVVNNKEIDDLKLALLNPVYQNSTQTPTLL